MKKHTIWILLMAMLLAGAQAYGQGATGGTITQDGSVWIHTFTSSGPFEITDAAGIQNVEILVVGGGGAGGGTSGTGTAASGGGGGGDFVTNAYANLAVQAISVTVGAGGTSTAVGTGGKGVNSTVAITLPSTNITAAGGGGGGARSGTSNYAPSSGGSGGGAVYSPSGTGGAGIGINVNKGGNNNNQRGGAGGGGAATEGTTAAGDTGKAGGEGMAWYGVTYSSGGGGGGSLNSNAAGGSGGTNAGEGGSASGGTRNNGGAAPDNYGGGGGGSTSPGGSTVYGGKGGSGVVIVRYELAGAIEPPAIFALSPENNAVDVLTTIHPTVTFDREIELLNAAGVTLTNLTAETGTTLASVVVSASTNLVITPDSVLETGDTYAVLIAPDAITDFAGITDTNTWQFTIIEAGTVPEVSALSPDNATGVSIDTDLVITFDQTVLKGTGNIGLWKVGGSSGVQTIAVSSGDVTVNGATVTIVLSTLDAATDYYVLIPAGTFTDVSTTLDFAGILTDSEWTFTTEVFDPPTVTTADGATNIGVGVATLTGKVTDNGNLALGQVIIYFGKTDGVETPGNWDTNFVFNVANITVGETFSTNVTGLLYGQRYYYRVFASNDQGGGWSDPEDFTTAIYDTSLALQVDFQATSGSALQSGFNKFVGTTDNGPPVTNTFSNVLGTNGSVTVVAQSYYWRDTSDISGDFAQLNGLLRDAAMRNSNGNIPVTLSGLIPGTYEMTTYHHYQANTGDSTFNLLLTDAIRNNEAIVTGAISSRGTSPATISTQAFAVVVNENSDDIVLTLNGTSVGGNNRMPLNGFKIVSTPVVDVAVAAATNIMTTAAYLNGTVNAEGAVLYVTAYWSTNENTTAQQWLDDGDKITVSFGGFTNAYSQSISHPLSGLDSLTTYYYTFQATNAVTNYWALPCTNFTTRSTATVSLTAEDLAQTYDGTARRVGVTTDPADLTVVVTYGGSTAAPTNAGIYAVVATIDEALYIGSTSGTLVIFQADPGVTEWPTASSIALGQTLASSTLDGGAATQPGAFAFADPGDEPPTGANVVWVLYNPTDSINFFVASNQVEVVVSESSATVSLSNLAQVYDGTAKSATATTDPAGLSVAVTYDGNAWAPTNVGNYAVTATITDPSYAGSTNGTLVISKGTPTVTALPTASGITLGQSLSASTLTGGTATIGGSPVAGTFAFVNPPFTPSEVGVYNADVTFTPNDKANLNSVAGGSVSVTVRSLIYSESFDYGDTEKAFNLGVGSWSTGSGSDKIQYVPTGSTHVGLRVVVGGAMYHTDNTAASVTDSSIDYSLSTLAAGESVWFAVLFDYVGGTHDHAITATGTDNTVSQLGFRIKADRTVWVRCASPSILNGANGDNNTGITGVTDGTYLLIIQAIKGTGSSPVDSTVHFWFNPASTAIPAALGDPDWSTIGNSKFGRDTQGFDWIAASPSRGGKIDEIRIGNVYNEVIPFVLQPSVFRFR